MSFNSIINSNGLKIKFICSIHYLLLCLYHIDRIDDIFYIFDKIPNILLKNNQHDIIGWDFYYLLSSFNLQLFINYFLKNNVNNITKNHLYECISIACQNDNKSIIKSLILNDEYKLFDQDDDDTIVYNLIKKCNNLEIIILLLKYINSKQVLDNLKSWIINNFNSFY